MKKYIAFFLCIMIAANTAYASLQSLDRVIAVVNGKTILKSELDDLVSILRFNQQNIPHANILQYQVLEEAIVDSIISQAAQNSRLRVSDGVIDIAIKEIAARNNLDSVQMKAKIEHAGISYSKYREYIQKKILVSMVTSRAVNDHISIHTQEISTTANQIDSYQAQETRWLIDQVTVPLPENIGYRQLSRKQLLAEHIAEGMKTGMSLEDIIIQNEGIVSSKAIRWEKTKDIPNLLARTLVFAKEGEVIGPIQSSIGFHILKVNGISREDRSDFFTEVHARHILIDSSENLTEDQVYQRVKNIRNDIKSNEISFSSAARNFSRDRSSAKQGGDLGWKPVTSFTPLYKDMLVSLGSRQISQPFRSSSGWCLLQLLDVRQVSENNERRMHEAYQLILSDKLEKQSEIWMRQERANSYIEILDKNEYTS